MNPEIDKLINLALTDGQVSDREREIILRKAEKLGLDVDEVEMYLEGKLGTHKNEVEINDIESLSISKHIFKIKKFESIPPAKLNRSEMLQLKIKQLNTNKIILLLKLLLIKKELVESKNDVKNTLEKTKKLIEVQTNKINEIKKTIFHTLIDKIVLEANNKFGEISIILDESCFDTFFKDKSCRSKCITDNCRLSWTKKILFSKLYAIFICLCLLVICAYLLFNSNFNRYILFFTGFISLLVISIGLIQIFRREALLTASDKLKLKIIVEQTEEVFIKNEFKNLELNNKYLNNLNKLIEK